MILHFTARGDYFQVNESGHIRRMDQAENGFHADWVLLGISSHHWHNRITVSLAQLFKNPNLMLKGYVWDKDHGTTRRWGGSGNVRVTAARVTTD